MAKKLIKKILSYAGVEVHRRIEHEELPAPYLELCKSHSLPILQPMALDEYVKTYPPLIAKPTQVPDDILLKHYESAMAAVSNESMSNYFLVDTSGEQPTLTDDYPASHYYSRQRMLTSVYRSCFGPTLKGCRVLDVGCSSGYYSFYCGRMGADQVVGIDARPEHRDQFTLLGRMVGIDARCEYRPLDMEFALEEVNESFDLVLAQGVIYHVYDHPRFIKNLYRITNKVLVLEGSCSGRVDNLCKPDIEETSLLRASIHGPVIYPSVSWLVTLLRWVGFKDITYVRFPAELEDRSGYETLWRVMLVAVK